MADFTPAPKPSAKAATAKAKPAKGGEVAKTDDAKEGTLTIPAEVLRKDGKKRAELLAAPDGTPGKDVAVIVEAELARAKQAGPIITAAVKDAKTWDELHGKAAQVTRKLAEKLAKLRMIYVDKNGKPDLGGKSPEYQTAANTIYERAGFDTGKTNTVQGAVRYHMSDVIRDTMRELVADGKADGKTYEELCEYYKINPLSASERRKLANKGGTKLPATTIPTDDAAKAYHAAFKYAHRALDAPAEIDPAGLSADDRESLIAELETLQARAAALLEALGD